MIQVVLITQDPDMRTVLDVDLHSRGHFVVSVPEAHQALPALEFGRYPAVVIIHAPTPADGGFDLIRRAASNAGGRLARHGYILLTTDPSTLAPARSAQLARLKAHVMELPIELEEIAAAVEGVNRELPAREKCLHTARVTFRQSAES
jgi:CheY-like chemotaxis protein